MAKLKLKRPPGRPRKRSGKQYEQAILGLFPDAIRTFRWVFKHGSQRQKIDAAKEVLPYVVPRLKGVEVKGDSSRPLGVVILPAMSHKGDCATKGKAHSKGDDNDDDNKVKAK